MQEVFFLIATDILEKVKDSEKMKLLYLLLVAISVFREENLLIELVGTTIYWYPDVTESIHLSSSDISYNVLLSKFNADKNDPCDQKICFFRLFVQAEHQDSRSCIFGKDPGLSVICFRNYGTHLYSFLVRDRVGLPEPEGALIRKVPRKILINVKGVNPHEQIVKLENVDDRGFISNRVLITHEVHFSKIFVIGRLDERSPADSQILRKPIIVFIIVDLISSRSWSLVICQFHHVMEIYRVISLFNTLKQLLSSCNAVGLNNLGQIASAIGLEWLLPHLRELLSLHLEKVFQVLLCLVVL